MEQKYVGEIVEIPAGYYTQQGIPNQKEFVVPFVVYNDDDESPREGSNTFPTREAASTHRQKMIVDGYSPV